MRHLIIALSLGWLALLHPKAHASLVDTAGLNRAVENAAIIVRGVTLSTKSHWWPASEHFGPSIYTTHTIKVLDVIRGTIRDSVLYCYVQGGKVGETQMVVHSGVWNDNVGDTTILWLRETSLGREPIKVFPLMHGGFFQGAYENRKRILSGDYVRYLKFIELGEKITLDSFLNVLPR